MPTGLVIVVATALAFGAPVAASLAWADPDPAWAPPHAVVGADPDADPDAARAPAARRSAPAGARHLGWHWALLPIAGALALTSAMVRGLRARLGWPVVVVRSGAARGPPRLLPV